MVDHGVTLVSWWWILTQNIGEKDEWLKEGRFRVPFDGCINLFLYCRFEYENGCNPVDFYQQTL